MDQTAVSNVDLGNQIAVLNSTLSQLVQFTSHLTTGGMTAHAIQWLKQRPGFSAIWKDLSDRGKVAVAACAAALPAAGIVFTFSHPGEGHYVFDLQNLSLATAGVFLWSFLQNVLAQQAYYASIIKPKEVTGPQQVAGQPPPHAAPVGVVVEGVQS